MTTQDEHRSIKISMDSYLGEVSYIDTQPESKYPRTEKDSDAERAAFTSLAAS